eukprot:g3544.t1
MPEKDFNLPHAPSKTPLLVKVHTPLEGRHKAVAYQGKGTFFASVITLANSAIGAGVLTFPYAFSQAGLGLAIILCVCLALLMGFSLHVIALSTEEAQKKDSRVRSYQDIVKLAMGERVSTAVEVALVLYLFGGCIAFLIIIGDMLEPMLPSTGLASHRWFAITALAVFVVAPLCQLKRISALRFSSSLAVLAVTYMVCMIIGEEPARHGDSSGGGGGGSDVKYFRGGSGFFISVPLMCLALQCHIPCALIYTELKPELRSIRTMDRVIGAAYAICLLLYVPAGVFGYLTFGGATTSDVLLVKHGAGPSGEDIGYAVSDKFAAVARVCITLTASFGFPIVHFPAKSALYDFCVRFKCIKSEPARPGRPQSPGNKIQIPRKFLVVEGVVWVALTLAIALCDVNLGFVNDIVASTCGSLVIFVFPALMWREFGPRSTRTRVQVGLLLVVGIAIMFCGTIVTILGAVNGTSD